MLSMKRVKRAGVSVVRIGVPVVLAFSVAGCGGGGSSSSTSSTSSATAVTVTQANSTQVAGAGYNAMNGAAGAGTTGTLGLTGVVSGGGGALPSLAAFVQQQVTELQALNAAGEVTATMAGLTTSVSCSASGTMSISQTGGTTLGPGDTVSVTFNNCSLTTGGYTINGQLQFAVSTLSGTLTSGGNWNVGGTFTFTSLSLTTGGATQTVNGGFSFNATSASGTTDATLSGTSLTLKQASGTSLTLSGFNLTAKDDTGTGATSFYGSGQVQDSALNGYVKFNIPSSTPLVQDSGQSYPSSGTMTITGANNTSVVLTVIDATSVQLQEDTTGNGTYDNTVTEPWTSLG